MSNDPFVLEELASLEWRLTDIMARIIVRCMWYKNETTVNQLVSLYFDIRAALPDAEDTD